MLQRARSPLAAAMVVVASLLVSLRVTAAPPSPSSSSSSPSVSEALAATLRETAPDSPRAAVEAFLDLCRDERFEEASKYLELSAAQRPRAAELAKRFKRVLDRHAWIDLSSVSGAPEGASNDGMAPNVDELATVPAGAGRTDPVRLVRFAHGAGGENGVRWMFSRGTVNRIDAWYERLDQRWIFENLPPILLKYGPFELMVWQWLALPAVFFLAWLAGWMLARLSRGIAIRLARRTRVQWDDAVIAQMNGPLVLAWSLVVARLALPWLGLYAPAEEWIHRGIRAGLFLAFFWALMRGLSVAASLLGESTWSNLNPASRSLIPLGTRVGKVLLVAVALV
ncbi:MAG TPA: mechanosensitive ion channel family protein, partial [Polyangiaceae bacterium]